MNEPAPLTVQEWTQITAMPEFRNAWGIEDDERVEDLIPSLYGVRFDFVSGGPGYVGKLYIIQGDALTGEPPFQVVERDGKYEPV